MFSFHIHDAAFRSARGTVKVAMTTAMAWASVRPVTMATFYLCLETPTMTVNNQNA